MPDDYTENQCWIHIYDNIGSFSSTKKIRHVHDIFTSKNYFCVDLYNIEFSGIEIIGRGVNSELLYLENDGEIRVSLDPLDRWPEAPKYSKKTKHVKVDVGYTLIQPNFDKNYFKTGYTSLMGMPKNIYPEFHIYLPKGLEIN